MKTVALITLLATTSALAEAPPLLPSSDAVFDHHLTLTEDSPRPVGLLKVGAIFGYTGAGVLAAVGLLDFAAQGWTAYGNVLSAAVGGPQYRVPGPGPGVFFIGAAVSLVVAVGLHIASIQLNETRSP